MPPPQPAAPASAAPPPRPRPLVDDGFWFERSKEMIQGASSKRAEAAGKLQTTIGWFWTVYAAGAVIGVTFADKEFDWWEAALIVAPIPVLVLGYWLAGWAQIPISVRFDPRAPDEIRAAHEASVKERKRRLLLSVVASAVGAVLVTVAVLTVSFADADEGADTGFSAAFDEDGDRGQVVVGGDFPSGTRVVFTVTPKSGSTLRRVLVTPASAEVHRVFEVPIAESYDVTATWAEEKVGTHSLTKTVAGEKVEEA